MGLFAAGGGAPGRPGGAAVLREPLLNKGCAFTGPERDALGLRGLLPWRVASLPEQAELELRQLRGLADDMDRCLALLELQNSNETLFYRLLLASAHALAGQASAPRPAQAALYPPLDSLRRVSRVVAVAVAQAAVEAGLDRMARGYDPETAVDRLTWDPGYQGLAGRTPGPGRPPGRAQAGDMA